VHKARKRPENHAIVDRHGLPLSVSTHAANHHEVRLVQLCFDFYMIEAKPSRSMIAPHRANRNGPPTQDRRRLSRYMRRWLVERFFAWSQWQRRITTPQLPGLCPTRLPRYPLRALSLSGPKTSNCIPARRGSKMWPNVEVQIGEAPAVPTPASRKTHAHVSVRRSLYISSGCGSCTMLMRFLRVTQDRKIDRAAIATPSQGLSPG
jgi:hypothetical protein